MEKRGTRSQRSNSWQHSPLPYILLILALAFFSNAVQTPSSPTGNPVLRHRINDTMKCSDSDGYNILLQGQCADGRRTFKDYCLSNTTLVEFTCSNTSVGCMQNVVNCASYSMICKNGACVQGGNIPDIIIANYSAFILSNNTNTSNQTASLVTVTATIIDAANTQQYLTFQTALGIVPAGINQIFNTVLSQGKPYYLLQTYKLNKGQQYTITIYADSGNTIAESNENNNKVSFIFKT